MDYSREDIQTWKADPLTKVWFQKVQALRSDMLEAWAAGSFTGESEGMTIQLNAHALGRISVLNELLESDFFEEEING